MIEFLGIKKSDNPEKKYVASFKRDGHILHTHFGQAGATDYTRDSALTREARKQRYLTRHRSSENWEDPTSAGALSRWILWNKPTVSASLSEYRQRFGF